MNPIDQFEHNVRVGIPTAVVFNPKRKPPVEALLFPAGTFQPSTEAANDKEA